MTLEQLADGLRGGGLDDLLLPGFIDSSDSPARFRANSALVYVQVSERLFVFRAVGSTGTLLIEPTATMELELDDDTTHAVTSLREQLLDDAESDNDLVALRLWGVEERADGVHCSAAQLELANGQQLFFDPTYSFGIRCGGAAQRRTWRKNWPGSKQLTEHTLSLAVT